MAAMTRIYQYFWFLSTWLCGLGVLAACWLLFVKGYEPWNVLGAIAGTGGILCFQRYHAAKRARFGSNAPERTV